MSSSAMVKISKVPPSSFSVLLRRSKFATYDPKIGQIYTTYDGHAHRGDWGLKRPLAVHRRDGRLLIHNIDTLYQQTEWTSTYTDALMMRKFEEIGVTLEVAKEGSWGPRLGVSGGSHGQPRWMHDSDYFMVPPEATKHTIKAKPPLPDPCAMTPRRFERYLRKVRRLEPEFREFLKNEEAKDLPSQRDVQARSSRVVVMTGADREHERFLSEKFMEACDAESSIVIHPMPHPTGGLTYNRSSKLQPAIDGKTIPGRRLQFTSVEDLKATYRSLDVDLGGWIAKEGVNVKENNLENLMTDFGTKDGQPRKNSEAGKDGFRPAECSLLSPPEVVAKYPQRIGVTALKFRVRSWSGANAARPNPYKPGTVEYIAHDEPKRSVANGKKNHPHTMMTYVRSPDSRSNSDRVKQWEEKPSQTISKLQALLVNKIIPAGQRQS